jgi:hypothetical protein
MVTVTRLDVGDATGVSVTVTVASLQGRTVSIEHLQLIPLIHSFQGEHIS